MPSRQTGFTLVEIAVVLVIIGLLLGGVLKGQELIDSAKVKNLAQDFRTTPTLLYAYQDKYRALPGDDRIARNHLCADAGDCTTNGDGNGAIDGNWNDTSTSEAFRFWQHVRLANLASGTTDTDDPGYLPRNAAGGRLGIQRGGSGAPLGLAGSYVMCADGVTGKLVRQLDIAIDDGNPAAGSMRAATTDTDGNLVPIASANPLVDANSHTVCVSL